MRGHKSLQLTASLLCVLSLIPALARAQEMCIWKPITVGIVKGEVFFGGERERIAVDDAVVQVVSQRENRVLGETATNSEGRFSIKGIKAGRYWLRVKHTHIIGIEVELVVASKSPKSEVPTPQIIFVLGGDPSKSCDGSKIELVEAKNPPSQQRKQR